MQIPNMLNHRANTTFLAAIDSATKDSILDSIATHYGISPQQAYDEVTAESAEHLLDYMVEPQRSATSVLMQAHGLHTAVDENRTQRQRNG